ncbi:hypothetical protein V3C99_013814 [Haemonchus contortus]|uniref:Uncharacterized protein n=1 Tax=Haemonchus contortus TaxID=6289 RepID=A0A7I4YQG8_HAECO
MLLMVLCAMIPSVSSQLLQSTQQRQLWNQQAQRPNAVRGHQRATANPMRSIRLVASMLPPEGLQQQHSASVPRTPSGRWNTGFQNGRRNRSPEGNDVMSNEGSILAGNMSPDFLKELSEYLYEIIIGKYEVRQQQHNQGKGASSPSNNEVVLDYEEETRAIDARIGDLNLLAANELQFPSRSQPSAALRTQSRSPQAAQRDQQRPASRTLPRIAQQRSVPLSHPRTQILFMAQPVPTQSEAVQIPSQTLLREGRIRTATELAQERRLPMPLSPEQKRLSQPPEGTRTFPRINSEAAFSSFPRHWLMRPRPEQATQLVVQRRTTWTPLSAHTPLLTATTTSPNASMMPQNEMPAVPSATTTNRRRSARRGISRRRSMRRTYPKTRGENRVRR